MSPDHTVTYQVEKPLGSLATGEQGVGVHGEQEWENLVIRELVQSYSSLNRFLRQLVVYIFAILDVHLSGNIEFNFTFPSAFAIVSFFWLRKMLSLKVLG